VVVAAFRGNDNAQQPTWHGELHRLGGAVFFTCLPLACRTLARTLATRQRWTALARRLGWLTVIGIATAAAFGVAQVVPALPEGLLERIALGGELALLLTLASGMRRAAR
jgi:hypothetical protein